MTAFWKRTGLRNYSIGPHLSRLSKSVRVRNSFADIEIRAQKRRSSDDVIVFSLVKNGAYYLKSFIEYYLSIGVNHIVLIDNGSTDATLSIALGYREVSIVQSMLPARDYECELRLHAAKIFGRGGWCLIADVDEFFDYPKSFAVNLNGLIRYLDKYKYNAMVCQMLDMYSSASVGAFCASDDFLRLHKYYETNSILHRDYHSHLEWYYWYLESNEIPTTSIKLLFGGVRKRMFGTNNMLSKHSLFKLDGEIDPLTHVHCCSRARCADITAVLKHYKFAGGFIDRSRQYLNEKTWSHGEDELYIRAIEERGDLNLMSESSICYESIDQLIEVDFLVESLAYKNWVTQSMSK